MLERPCLSFVRDIPKNNSIKSLAVIFLEQGLFLVHYDEVSTLLWTRYGTALLPLSFIPRDRQNASTASPRSFERAYVAAFLC